MTTRRRADPPPRATRPPALGALQRGDKGDPRLLEGLAADRAAAVLQRAAVCPACAAVRREEGDDGALCDDHLGQALGVSGGWALGPEGKKLL